jgi:hypothetical protein
MNNRPRKPTIVFLHIAVFLTLLFIFYSTVVAYPDSCSTNVPLRAQKVYYVSGLGWIRCGGCPANMIGCQWCWAACYSSAISFLTEYHSILEVVDEAKGQIICESAYITDLPGLLNNPFGINSTYSSGKPSESSVEQCIYDQHPILINVGGHAVLLYGYWHDGSDFYIGYMDPWDPSWEEHKYSTWSAYNCIKMID